MWLAKTKVTTSYLYLAKKLGAEVDQFHEVSDLVPLDRGGFEVHSRESCFRVARGIRPPFSEKPRLRGGVRRQRTVRGRTRGARC